MANSKDSIVYSVLMTLIVIGISIVGAIDIDGWDYGHATFYGDVKGHETEGKLWIICNYTCPFS